MAPQMPPPVLSIPATARVTQVIVLALSLACVVAGIVFTAVVPPRNERHLPTTLTGLAFAMGAATVRFVVPLILTPAARRTAGKVLTSDQEAGRRLLAQSYLSSTIVAAALLEGGVFANLVFFHQTGHYANAILAGILFLGIPALFPTSARIEDWIESQVHLI